MPDRLEEIDKPDNDSPSTSHNDKKRPLVLNLENLYDISSELSSQGQILSQVVQDIQLHHQVCIPCPVQLRRECVSTGAAGARTPQIFGTSPFAPADFEASSTICTRCFETQSSPGCTCTRRSKFLTHSLDSDRIVDTNPLTPKTFEAKIFVAGLQRPEITSLTP